MLRQVLRTAGILKNISAVFLFDSVECQCKIKRKAVNPCKNKDLRQFIRAIDGARTRGLDLGKVARYQLRHYRMCFFVPREHNRYYNGL